jgi:hypothetical protein
MKVHDEVVIDAKRSMLFTVTEDDVKEGMRLKSRECPGNFGILREARKVCPTLVRAGVRVHVGRVYIRLPVKTAKKKFGADVPKGAKFVWVRFATSRELRDEVVSMDTRGVFRPGDYHIYPKKTKPSTAASRAAAALAQKERTKKIAAGFKPRRNAVVAYRKFGVNR